ncbi:MAG: alginate export family protein [Acidobacteria bacterium]|nr:alginate export family protein [Acidobacteriota bacterium]
MNLLSVIVSVLMQQPAPPGLPAAQLAPPAQKAPAEAKAAAPLPKWHLFGETRAWAEQRGGAVFGRERDVDTVLIRNRLGIEVRPKTWLKIGAMVQDTRAPHYQRARPGTAQDPTDLHEAYVEINPEAKRGWGAVAGRKRLSLGEQHVIGVPEWGNSGRTYDLAQLDYRRQSMRLRLLFVSAVKFQPERFNVPVLGDRLWGVYYELPKAITKGVLDLYLLRHDQNVPGGFRGAGRLGSSNLGTRVQVPVGKAWRLSTETIGQTGTRGLGQQRALGTISSVSRRFGWHESQGVVEYKFASPDFDQLYPAHHNRLGHSDLIYLRNVHSIQPQWKVALGRHTRLNAMYTANWLVDATQPLYGFTGTSIGRDARGQSGRFAGQEYALFSTHSIGHWQLGLGYAYWKAGEFVRKQTPGASPHYVYLHMGFTF